jgi:hypothetical protein
MGVQNAQEMWRGVCPSQPDLVSGPSRGNAAILASQNRMTFGGVVALDDVSVTVGVERWL